MDVTILRNRLENYLAAEAAILRGQEYVIGDRRLRRPDLSEIRKVIDDLSAQIDTLELRHGRVKQVVFVD